MEEREKRTLAHYLHHIFLDDEFAGERELLLQECDIHKVLLLWQILFETDIEDRDLLEDRIFCYGSKLTEKDYVGREIFLCLVMLLKRIER